MVCHKIAKKEEGREAKAAFYDFHINALQLQRETVWYIGNGATFESASSILHSHYLASTACNICMHMMIYTHASWFRRPIFDFDKLFIK